MPYMSIDPSTLKLDDEQQASGGYILIDPNLIKLDGPEYTANALNQIASNQAGISSGKLDPFAAGISDVGAVVGNTANAVGDAVFKPVIDAGVGTAKFLFPRATQNAQKLAGVVANSATVKAIENRAAPLAMVANAELQNHPNAEAILGGLGNIGNAATTLEGLGSASRIVGVPLKATGEALYNGGVAADQGAHEAYVKGLVFDPQDTKKQKIEAAANYDVTGPGKSAKAIYQPTNAEKASLKATLTIPDISRSNTIRFNRNMIEQAKDQEAQSLRSRIELIDQNSNNGFGINYDRGDFNSTIDDAKQNFLNENPLLSDENKAKVDEVFDNAKKAAEINGNNPIGLLNARQQFDQYSISQKPNVFDNTSPIFSKATRAARRAKNQYISSLVPDASVAESLAKQSALFDALDNADIRAAPEKLTAKERLQEKLQGQIPGKNSMIKGLSLLTGAGVAGAGAIAVPHATMIGLGLAGGLGAATLAAKAAAAPVTRKAVGSLLEGAGKFAGPLSKSDLLKLPPAIALQYLKETNGQKLQN